MSNERCSTATSGVYSVTESDSSNAEQSMTDIKHDKFLPSRDMSLGLPQKERKSDQHTNKHFQKNANSGQSFVSRIPPPKPLRYKIQKSSRDLPYLGVNSDGDQSLQNTLQNSRILQNKKKTSSYMNIRSKDAQILV